MSGNARSRTPDYDSPHYRTPCPNWMTRDHRLDHIQPRGSAARRGLAPR